MLLFWYRIYKKKYNAEPLIMYYKFRFYILYTSLENKSNWRNASPRTILQRYWILTPVSSAPIATILTLKLFMNNRNSSRLKLSNKHILNSYKSDVLDIGYLRNSSLTKSLSDLPPYVPLMRGINGVPTCDWVIPEFHPLLSEIFFIVAFFLHSSSSRRFICKVSYTPIVLMTGLIIVWVNVTVI